MKPLLDEVSPLLPSLENLYKDLHRHPELSHQERRTARIAADALRAAGFEVTANVGGHGVVGILRNGDGPVVWLRADMDGLPVTEDTGLDYASQAVGTTDDGDEVGVAHACGHDVHVTCLIGAVRVLSESTTDWNGTLVAIFQPAEETLDGASAMIDDGLLDRAPKPDVVLGQHVAPVPAGIVLSKPGTTLAATDNLEITLFGKGSHGSRPEAGIDPVVMAASLILRLQTIVSREIAPDAVGVITVGSVQAGKTDNVIPEQATLKLTVRSRQEKVRQKMLAAIRRMAAAESAASDSERDPEITVVGGTPTTDNDPEATAQVKSAMTEVFGAARVAELPMIPSGSEDFCQYGIAADAPSTFWLLGGADPARFLAVESMEGLAHLVDSLPANHSPKYAPVIEPTLEMGTQALMVAALAWLAPAEVNTSD